ncbi:MAG: TRAP transporter substrate-binding protein [Chloroflexota bacterium]
MKNRKWGVLVLSMLTIVLIAALIGCAPAEQETSPAETSAPPTEEQEPIELTYGQTVSAEHTFSQADKLWIDYIHEKTNGRVEITPYWGATLVSRAENTEELLAGVADLSYLSPRSGFPLMLGTLGFPYGVPTWEEDVAIYEDIFEQFPELDAEWSELKIMAKSVASNYHLISTKPVRSVEDFQGMKIKATGMYIEAAKALGADAFYVPMGETYTALQKGTIDACFAPYDTLKSFSFYEVAPYVTVLNLQSAVRPSRGMNLDSYNSLPSDIQETFDESVEFWSLEDNKARARVNQEGKELAKENGVEFIEMPEEDMAEVYEAMDEVCRAEAAKLDEKGLPGTEIYEAVRSEADEYIP